MDGMETSPQSVRHQQQQQLSAEAEIFIPIVLNTNETETAAAANEHSTKHRLTHSFPRPPHHHPPPPSQLTLPLPRYATTCFPFVTHGTPGPSRPRLTGTWQGPGRPFPCDSNQLNTNYASEGSSFLMTTASYNDSDFSTALQYSPYQYSYPLNFYDTPNSNAPTTTLSLNNSEPSYGFPVKSINTNAVMFQPDGQMLCLNNHSSVNQFQTPVAHQRRIKGPHNICQGQREGNRTQQEDSQKTKKKKQSPANNNLVSIGSQYELFDQQNKGTEEKPKSRKRTIIFKDCETQTDFSSEVSGLSLVKRPSPLYEDSPRRWAADNSTESDEMDSDSGYSASPLRQMANASSGANANDIRRTLMPYRNPAHYVHTTNEAPGKWMRQENAVPPNFCLPNVDWYSNSSDVHMFPADSLIRGFVPHDLFDHSLHPARFESAYSPWNTSYLDNATPMDGRFYDDGSMMSTAHHQQLRRQRHRQRRHFSPAVGINMGTCRDSSTGMDAMLYVRDADEFPRLLSAVGGLPPSPSDGVQLVPFDGVGNKSMIMRSGCFDQSSSNLLNRKKSAEVSIRDCLSKSTKKKQKRQEQLSRAADEELAEISLEQQVLREISSGHRKLSLHSLADGVYAPSTFSPPTPCPPPPPSATPTSLDLTSGLISDDVESFASREIEMSVPVPEMIVTSKDVDENMTALDANGQKRNISEKNRRLSKGKKPSPMKKVIWKEREDKQRDSDQTVSDFSESVHGLTMSLTLASLADSPLNQVDLSQSTASSKNSSMDTGGRGTPRSADLSSPISQESPLSISSPAASPFSSGMMSPKNEFTEFAKSSVISQIHSPRFREYCKQVLSREIDECCVQLLRHLVGFHHDRYYQNDDVRSNQMMRRRTVLGLREVTKRLKICNLKCVIISPNMERIQSKGGLDEALNNIIKLCDEQKVLFVFALGRRALGRACAKLVPVSVVGIVNDDGAEDYFRRLQKLTREARGEYQKMVSSLERVVLNRTDGTTTTTAATHSMKFNHSRTPSACSIMSLTSSILSEPISENDPCCEPDLDAQGNEVVVAETTAAETRATLADDGETTSTSNKDDVLNGVDENYDESYDDDDDEIDESLPNSCESVDDSKVDYEADDSEDERTALPSPTTPPEDGTAAPTCQDDLDAKQDSDSLTRFVDVRSPFGVDSANGVDLRNEPEIKSNSLPVHVVSSDDRNERVTTYGADVNGDSWITTTDASTTPALTNGIPASHSFEAVTSIINHIR